MRVLVLGGGGMLGHKLYQVFSQRFDTWATVRADPSTYAKYGLFKPDRLLAGLDAYSPVTAMRVIREAQPEVVVNSIGIVKQLPDANDPVSALTVNSLFPQRLAQLCNTWGVRLIHLSSDCVFSGRKGGYLESDEPDAQDLYGRSKLLGEVAAPHLTLRTSIVGRELATRHGLLEWFLTNRGKTVQGWTTAIFSGLPTLALALLVADVIEHHKSLSGLYHVGAAAIDKDALLRLWREAYDLPVEIEPTERVREDRSLDSSRFRVATGYAPPPWPKLVAAMVQDPTPYDDWRRSGAANR